MQSPCLRDPACAEKRYTFDPSGRLGGGKLDFCLIEGHCASPGVEKRVRRGPSAAKERHKSSYGPQKPSNRSNLTSRMLCT